MKKIKICVKYAEILLITILLVCSCLFIGGCATENDGFRYVSSITFITNGEYITKKSTYIEDYIIVDQITKEEYDAASAEERYPYSTGEIPIQTKASLPPEEQMGVTNYTSASIDADRIYYHAIYREFDIPHTIYCTVRHTGRYYRYIQVKILDNTTIQIKEPRDRITTYIVTRYSITELK